MKGNVASPDPLPHPRPPLAPDEPNGRLSVDDVDAAVEGMPLGTDGAPSPTVEADFVLENS